MTVATAARTALPTATEGQLVPGDYVEYQGSIAEFHGYSFVVVDEEFPATPLVLACLGDGVPIPDAQRRYHLENVTLGATLKNVRRQSVLLLGY